MIQKDKLGKRLTCAECNTKYYDLNRRNAQCPKCGSTSITSAKSKFKIVKPVEIEMETEETEFLDSDDDVEILPLDSMDKELTE